MWDVKAPTHCPQRVGDVVPGVIAYLKFTLTKGAYLLISFIKLLVNCTISSLTGKSPSTIFMVFSKRPEVRSHFYGICEFVVVVVFLFFLQKQCYLVLLYNSDVQESRNSSRDF